MLTLVCVCRCSVSWLFWLTCRSLPNDWLDRLLWGRLFVVKRLSPQSPGQRELMTFSFLCIVSLFFNVCLSCPLGPRDIFHTPVTRCSLFVLKVPLNTNKPTSHIHSLSQWPCMTYKTKTDFFLVWDRSCPWGTGVRGPMRGMATLPQGNQELLVVRDKVGRPQVSLG